MAGTWALGHLDAIATKTGEKCGLVLLQHLPLFTQDISLTFEKTSGLGAGLHAIDSKMAKIIPEFAPGNHQHGVNIVNDRQRANLP